MTDYTELLAGALDLDEEDHGKVGLQIYGPLGAVLTDLQRVCMRARMDGKREAYLELVREGAQVKCPVCEAQLSVDTLAGTDLSEDVLMCQNCRNG